MNFGGKSEGIVVSCSMGKGSGRQQQAATAPAVTTSAYNSCALQVGHSILFSWFRFVLIFIGMTLFQ